MKISSIEPMVVRAQDTGKEDSTNVGGYTGFQVLVKIQTDDGITGWGECCTGSELGEAAWAVKTLIEKGLSQKILGDNPLEYRKIWWKLYYAIEWYGKRGLGVFALSGIDTALLDICGKSLGVPVYNFFGGCFNREIKLYASLLFDMDNPEETAKKALTYVRDGYFGVKFGWGLNPKSSFGLSQKRDLEIVKTIRDAIGPDTPLMVDVGRYVNWSVSYAVTMAKKLEKYDVYWLEEPLPSDDIDGYASLSRSVDVPIAAGEGYQTAYEFQQLISKDAVDIIQPDPSKLGGLSEAKEIVSLAHIYNKQWVPHNWSTAVNTAACIHLVASSPSGFLLEFKKEANPLVHDILKRKFEIVNGKLRVSDKEGLGIEVDEDRLSHFLVS
jgi:L-rhamnonate dehydratase